MELRHPYIDQKTLDIRRRINPKYMPSYKYELTVMTLPDNRTSSYQIKRQFRLKREAERHYKDLIRRQGELM